MGITGNLVLEDSTQLIEALGSIGLYIQTVGLIVIIWIFVQAITMFYNRKRRLLLIDIDDRITRIEKKIDKLSRKR